MLTLNQIDVEGKSGDYVVEVLRKIAPGTAIEVGVQRDAGPTTVSLVCQNSRPIIETILAGLDAAGRSKFEECENTFASRSDLGAMGAGMRLTCAAVGRKPDANKLARLAYESLRERISEAYWVPSLRQDVINGLHQGEGLITGGIGAARFQELVAATQRWPGGESMFEGSKPDMRGIRRAAEQALRSRLIDPESARIEWPYGFLYGSWKPPFQKKIDGYWTCGLVNARNRMGGYTGSTSFVAVVSSAGAVQYVETGSGGDFDLIAAQCAKAVKLLPPAPREFVGDTSGPSASSGSSLADELKKLSDLRANGALSEEEFQAAKQRLLSPDGP
ncbi:SHOCT domain-containing protein [Luteimonas sp. MJ246]|uniref:SHOCT domain-containing protein n=1 Tax=Luteimonas sp. MJ174 TaxID=3129237 RepID=UPI0031BB308D